MEKRLENIKKKCKSGTISCCSWCAHDHRKYCPVGIEEERRKVGIKSLQAKHSVTEAYTAVENLEQRTKTKRKNRTVVAGTFADDPEKVEAIKPKKGKSSLAGKLSEKEETILKVAELVGVELANPDKSRNYSSGSFSSCGMVCCKRWWECHIVSL